MKQISELMKGNTVLSEDQAKRIEDSLIIAARRAFVGRKVFGTDVSAPMGLGVQTYSYDTMSEVSDANISTKFTQGQQDLPKMTRTNKNTYVIQKEFEIDRRDLLANENGVPLDTSTADSVGYKVGLLEDEMLLNGISFDGTNYDIDGLYQGAGNDASTSADFGTAGKPISATKEALGLLFNDNINGPFNMVLNPTQFAELSGSVYTGGVNEFDRVKNMIGGEIYMSPAISDGTGLVVATPGRGYYAYKVCADMTLETEILPKSKNLFGRAFVAGTIVIYDSNCACQMSNI